MNSHAKFCGATRRGFSAINEKPQGGRIPAPLVGARVKSRENSLNIYMCEDSEKKYWCKQKKKKRIIDSS